MKKIFFVSLFLLFLGFTPHAFAEGFVPLAGIPGLTQGVTANTAGLATFFNNLYKYLIGVAAILAVIMIIWGGLEISTQDSISKQGAGKEKIKNAIYGLILVLSPVLVFSIINPSILNLSLNLPPIDLTTKSGTPTTATTTPKRTTTNVTSSTKYFSCTDKTCAKEKTSCSTGAGLPDVVCLKSDMTVDPNGRTDHWYNFDYLCIAGENLAVACDYIKVQ